MNEMFPNGIFYDERKNMSIIWEHFIDGDLDVIEATYFVKNRTGHYEKLKELYEKRVFLENEIRKKIEKNNLNLLCINKNDKIAGKRYFYVLKKGK